MTVISIETLYHHLMEEILTEEVEVVNSIYEDCVAAWAPHIYTIYIPDTSVSCRLSFPPEYPEKAPHLLQIEPAHLQDELQTLITSTFIPGEPYIYSFVDEVKSQLPEDVSDEETEVETPVQPVRVTKGSQWISKWTVSDDIVDRKSTFAAYAAKANSQEEALELIDDLLQDKRVGRASHNIQAWRIERPDGLMVQDCDDDGESAAGGRVLHLLNLTKAVNVVVVVSRWFGGTHIGPDRFKHINASAREALLKGGFIH